jgi:NADH:ubiquinone reductase (non-electrogenic)
MALTPLLASAAWRIFDFWIAEEPVRRLGNAGRVTKYQVHVSEIDLDRRKVRCKAAVGVNGNTKLAAADGMSGGSEQVEESEDVAGDDGEFDFFYDTLILAPGSETNTFDTPGVLKHCLTTKSVQDTMQLRERILDCFELASLPIF